MKSESASINISVTFRQTEPTEALRNYATEKLSQLLKKYVKEHTEVKVVLMVQKRDHTAEVLVHSKGYDASSKATTEDLYSAIDKVVDTITTQLRRQKERAADHHRNEELPLVE